VTEVVEETVETTSADSSGTSCREDIRIIKTVRVMVERIDNKMNKRQMDQLLKYKAKAALETKQNDVQVASTSSKVKRKRSNTINKK